MHDFIHFYYSSPILWLFESHLSVVLCLQIVRSREMVWFKELQNSIVIELLSTVVVDDMIKAIIRHHLFSTYYELIRNLAILSLKCHFYLVYLMLSLFYKRENGSSMRLNNFA